MGSELLGCGSKSAVESDHDPIGAGRSYRGLDVVQLGLGDGERLLDEDRLAGLNRANGVARMRSVARRDDHGIDILIGEDCGAVGTGEAETELLLGTRGRERRRGDHMA